MLWYLSHDTTQVMPDDMKVVTFGSSTAIFATVVYKAKLASDPTKPMFVVLVRSKDTTSVGLALEGLLLLTGKLLRKQWFRSLQMSLDVRPSWMRLAIMLCRAAITIRAMVMAYA